MRNSFFFFILNCGFACLHACPVLGEKLFIIFTPLPSVLQKISFHFKHHKKFKISQRCIFTFRTSLDQKRKLKELAWFHGYINYLTRQNWSFGSKGLRGKDNDFRKFTCIFLLYHTFYCKNLYFSLFLYEEGS